MKKKFKREVVRSNELTHRAEQIAFRGKDKDFDKEKSSLNIKNDELINISVFDNKNI